MRGVRSSLLLPLAAAACLLAGCEADGSYEAERGEPPETTLEIVGHETRPPPTKDSFPADTAAWMEEALRRFEDPSWHQLREEWLALGESESRFLVFNMFAGLLRAQQANRPDMVERFRHELVLIGAPSVEMCADLLANSELFTARDRDTGEETTLRVDDAPRKEAARILALIGEPAVELTVWAAENADAKPGRLAALRALGDMGDRGGPVASAALEEYASDDDWVIRSEAVLQLGRFSDDASVTTLVVALTDEEELVRTRAADSLGKRGAESALPALREADARARDEGNLVETRAMQRAIRKIEALAEKQPR